MGSMWEQGIRDWRSCRYSGWYLAIAQEGGGIEGPPAEPGAVTTTLWLPHP